MFNLRCRTGHHQLPGDSLLSEALVSIIGARQDAASALSPEPAAGKLFRDQPLTFVFALPSSCRDSPARPEPGLCSDLTWLAQRQAGERQFVRYALRSVRLPGRFCQLFSRSPKKPANANGSSSRIRLATAAAEPDHEQRPDQSSPCIRSFAMIAGQCYVGPVAILFFAATRPSLRADHLS